MANINRREFLKTNAAATFSLALAGTGIGKAESRADDKDIRLGIVGMGNRGKALLRTLLTISGVKITALCDIDKERLAFAQGMVVKGGQLKPEGYSKDEYVFKQLMNRDDLDGVIITTPWEWHTPMAVYGMKAGKYVGVEVPAAQTIEECWELVKTYEQTKVPCMMMENWSFRRDNLAVLNIIRKGLFGQVVHCHCAHSHDCIDHFFFDEETGKDRWAAKYLVNRNRDQYPSHQLGPVISWLDIGNGDYYDYLTATATDSRSINDYFIHKFGPDHPNSKRKYAQGDIVTTIIRTKKGKTIVDNYDMQLPRPYDNRWSIQGTRGIYNEQRNSIYLKDKSPEYHQWEPFGPYQEEYDHIWWKVMQGKVSPTGHEDTSVDKQLQLGHGGTDYLELKLFTNAVRNKTQTPLDVYDAVVMCITGPLSEQSIANGSAPVKCPDFTDGRWKTQKKVFALDV
ncbi:MAG: Gfo/Idh/MocA family oxidoreductase [Planctomycetota bacterium]|jgi:predicted dehydrogenase